MKMEDDRPRGLDRAKYFVVTNIPIVESYLY